MLSYSIRRFFQAGFVLIAMSFLVFVGVYAIGNPVDLLVNPQADEAERIRATISMGLDKPFYAQYFAFLGAASTGDFGRSFVFNIPALSLILQKLPTTFKGGKIPLSTTIRPTRQVPKRRCWTKVGCL